MYKAFIKGIGHYTPKKVLTNKDLEKMVDTSDEWITTRTGIKERRIAADDETSSTLGAAAAQMAIKNAGISAEDIDLIITNTITPDMPFPNTSALIQTIIGAKNAGVFDIEAACTGFIYGISIANQFIKTGEYKNILVISAEILTRITDWKDRNTCVLFGDGAGAVVVGRSETESEIIGTFLGGDGAYKDLLYMPGGGSLHPATEDTVKNRLHFIKMKGNETFKVAVTRMADSAEVILKKENISPDDISLVIPHQANMRIMSAVVKRLGLPPEKLFSNIHKYGNTSAATIPIALSEAVIADKIKKGDLVLFVAFGGGFTWGAAIIRY